MKRQGNFSIITSLKCTSSANRPRTPLFEAILRCAWDNIRSFLLTGIWHPSAADYGDSIMSPGDQAQKWETYYDSYIQERLRQLPLHAAISYLAPLSIVKMLVNLYPESVRYPDSKGNLPLHLAFMTNAKDVSSFLLKFFPEGLMEANENGKLPVECYRREYMTQLPKSTAESQMEVAQLQAKKELHELEQKVVRDEQRILEAQLELLDIKRGFQTIQSSRWEVEHGSGRVEL